MQQVPSSLEFHCSTKGNSFENKSFFLVPFFMVLTDLMMIKTHSMIITLLTGDSCIKERIFFGAILYICKVLR